MKDIKEILKFLRELPKMIGMLNMPTEKVDIVQSIREIVYEWKGYKDLEKRGKLLKPPCAVGDTVYTNVSMQGWYFRKKNRPYEAKIVFVGINGADNYINVDFRDGYMIQFKFTDIGKTVFLTKEEAEAALKEL